MPSYHTVCCLGELQSNGTYLCLCGRRFRPSAARVLSPTRQFGVVIWEEV